MRRVLYRLNSTVLSCRCPELHLKS